jgi:hypothetical protein
VKATNSTLRHLIEGTKVFAVPLYQRRYSWDRPNWIELWKSILEQYEYAKQESPGDTPLTHFIGSVVLAPAPGAASAPTRYVLVDGQQRLTTTMVALAALRDLLAEQAKALEGADESTGATAAGMSVSQALILKYNTLYLRNAFEVDPLKVLRLLPTQQDRADYEATVGATPAAPSGRIGEAYDFFRSTKAMRGTDLDGVALDLNQVSEVLLSRLTLVEISTEPGDNVHRIFQTLNSAGVKLKQIDLLRNHFFMLLPTRGEKLYAELWRDMELRLGESILDRFFWAQLVRTDPRVSRTDVYAAMQRRLEPIATDEAAVESELRSLNQDSHSYLALVQPVRSTPDLVEQRLSALREWGADTARPLMLELIIRMADGRLSASAVAESLLAIESFLVRRMLVGIPTNNLNRTFSSLTPTLARGDFSPADLKEALAAGQKYWPSDRQVATSIGTRPFYFSGQPHQRRFILEKIADTYAGKERVELDQSLSIEHLMPRTLSASWLNYLSDDPGAAQRDHEQYLHTLGNLTLSGYNSELSNNDWSRKRQELARSSLAINRQIAAEYEVWNVSSIQDRAVELSNLVVRLWPGPAVGDVDTNDLATGSVEDALLLMPDSGFTTVRDLSEMSGLSESELVVLVRSLPEDLSARVLRAGSEAPVNHTHFDGGRLAQLLQENGDFE